MDDDRPFAGRRLPAVRWPEFRALALFLAGSAAALLFLLLANGVTEGDTRAVDEAVLRALRDPADPAMPRGPWWLRVMVMDLTSLGSVTVLALVTILVSAYLALSGRRGSALLVLASVLGGWGLSQLLKLGIGRARPDVVGHLVTVHDLSFPSGHAMLSAATYLTLGALVARTEARWRLRAVVMGGAVLVTLAIGLSRLYLGVHYPTDVLGGWIAGAAWALACWLMARRLGTF